MESSSSSADILPGPRGLLRYSFGREGSNGQTGKLSGVVAPEDQDYSFAASMLENEETSEARFHGAMSDTGFEMSDVQEQTKSELETAIFTTWVKKKYEAEVSFVCFFCIENAGSRPGTPNLTLLHYWFPLRLWLSNSTGIPLR